ncbi:hypothetical protein T265_14755, partial [Opisthorchis viverrini]
SLFVLSPLPRRTVLGAVGVISFPCSRTFVPHLSVHTDGAMDSHVGWFSKHVSSEVNQLPLSPKSEDVITCERLVQDAAKEGAKHLKLVMRRVNLPPTHPVRRTLWPLLLSVRYGVTIPSENSPDMSPTSFRAEDERSTLGGYELADQALCPTFYLNDDGQKSLRSILRGVAIAHPELVYAPQLWPLLALFLHYHSEPIARACLLGVLERGRTVTQTKSEWKEHCLALEQIGRFGFVSRQVLRAGTGHVEGSNGSPSGAGLDPRVQLALWTVAVWQLPFGHLVRLVDCFLMEGQKILFRTGLLLWKFAYKLTLNTLTKPMDLVQAATHMPLSPGLFVKRMFSILNFSQNDIRKAIQRVQQLEAAFPDQAIPDSLLIRPCVKAGYATCASYLLPWETSSPTTYVHPSQCISVSELAYLIRSIAAERLVQLCKPVLLFNTNTDGTSLQTLYARAASVTHPESILLVRSSSGCTVIGAFCSHRWQVPKRPSYFGNGMCFLFRVRPGPIAIYSWVGARDSSTVHEGCSQSFQYATADGIQVGGPSTSGLPGLGLDVQLSTGTSGPSATFDNPCLISDVSDMTAQFGANKEACSFSVGLVELIGFEDL